MFGVPLTINGNASAIQLFLQVSACVPEMRRCDWGFRYNCVILQHTEGFGHCKKKKKNLQFGTEDLDNLMEHLPRV